MKSTLIPAVIAVIGLWSGICTALSSTPKTGQTSPLQPKTAVLICPAQFCVPADYTTLIESLKSRNKNIKKCVVADLPRTVSGLVYFDVLTQLMFSMLENS